MTGTRVTKSLAVAAALGALSLGAAGTADAAGISVGGGALKITGDAQDDHILLKLHAGDSSKLDIDLDGDNVADTTVPLVDFKTISADLGDGDDRLTINDVNGSFTDQRQATILGGPGDDVLAGGAGGELIAGGDDADFIFGEGGNDTIGGGEGDDHIEWGTGDGDDFVDAGAGGDDVVAAIGTNGSEAFTIVTSGTFLRVLRNGEGALTLSGADQFHVAAGGGGDHITAAREAGQLARLTLNAGGGATNDNDQVLGSDSADVIRGEAGADKLDGRGGDDTIIGGLDDDTMIGGPGHDSLTGGAGTDSFQCDETGEILDLEPGEPFTPICVPPTPPTGDGGDTAPPTQTTRATDPLGFAKPRARATRTGLRVTLKSTSSAPVSVSLRARERFGSRRAARYRIVRKTIAVGGRITFTLRAPRALRERIAHQLALRGRVVRRPVIAATNTTTAARTAVHPRLSLRAR